MIQPPESNESLPYDEEEETEDPLEGDVDKFVHPDETRTDAQIEHDERYAIEPYDDDEEDWEEEDPDDANHTIDSTRSQ